MPAATVLVTASNQHQATTTNPLFLLSAHSLLVLAVFPHENYNIIHCSSSNFFYLSPLVDRVFYLILNCSYFNVLVHHMKHQQEQQLH